MKENEQYTLQQIGIAEILLLTAKEQNINLPENKKINTDYWEFRLRENLKIKKAILIFRNKELKNKLNVTKRSS